MAEAQNTLQKDYTAKQLPIFSPYRIAGLKTIEGEGKVTNSDGTTRTFPSKTHNLTIIPRKNEKLEIHIKVFDQEFQNMRALADLYGGFENCWITTKVDPSSTSRKLILIHSAETRTK